jgi:hypothetical protein
LDRGRVPPFAVPKGQVRLHTQEADGQMTDEADEALLRRLQNVANYLRRTEPAVADDMKAAIRYEQSSPEGRENMRVDRTFGSLISRLEKRAARAIAENHPLANDLQTAAELIRRL